MKRALAVHDLSGYGRCSLGVAVPVLAAMGIRACPLATAYLSANTAYPPSDNMVFVDMTEGMETTLRHWEELGARFDGFYSGFLGSVEQIGLLRRYLETHRGPGFLALVDPVMGDHGAPYRTYTPEMCRQMAELAQLADVITPNLTEAALLLGEEYDPAPGEEKTRAWLRRLSLEGRRSVVLTGFSSGASWLGAGCLERETGEVTFFEAPLAPGHFAGSGDLFASVLFGRLLGGGTLAQGTREAVEFVSLGARYTLKMGDDPIEGVTFEPLLRLLTAECPPEADALGL